MIGHSWTRDFGSAARAIGGWCLGVNSLQNVFSRVVSSGVFKTVKTDLTVGQTGLKLTLFNKTDRTDNLLHF